MKGVFNLVRRAGCQCSPCHETEKSESNRGGEQQAGEFQQAIPLRMVQSQRLQSTADAVAQMNSKSHHSEHISPEADSIRQGQSYGLIFTDNAGFCVNRCGVVDRWIFFSRKSVT